MSDDDLSPEALAKGEAHNRIAAAIKAMTGLVTGPPNLIGVDPADLRAIFKDAGPAVFGEGEASGQPEQGRATRAAEIAIAEIKRQLKAPI